VFTLDRLQARRILAGPVDRTVRVVIMGVATEIVFPAADLQADPLYQLLLTYGSC